MTRELLEQIHQWQKETFGKATPISKLRHLEKEILELIIELNGDLYTDNYEKVEEEYADCFLLLFGSAMAYGMNLDIISSAIKAKFEKNKLRKWGKPDVNGVIEHIKE
jgi:hypothetical protein